MTLGEPQPLSRRQARELARGEAAATGDNTNSPVDAPVLLPPTLTPAKLTNSTLRPAIPASSGGAESARRMNRNTPSEPEVPAKKIVPAVPAASAAPDKRDLAVPAEHTLSRRELRALHARLEANETDATPAASVEQVRVEAESLHVEPAESELVGAEVIEPEPSEVSKPSGFVLVEPERMYAEWVAPVSPEPVSPEPASPKPASSRPDAMPEPQTPNRVEQHAAWTPTVGHWSVEPGEPSHESAPEQSLDELINRRIGAGGIPTTTNALILPLIPNQGPSVSPISNTGEIMITGSFDLPRSLGSTGAHPNLFDSSEMDHMLDQLDADQLGSGSVPVSASHAVSTHASTRGMLAAPKKQRASLPLMLVVIPAVLALSVLALFVTGYLLRIF
jgi:hypothetical protein